MSRARAGMRAAWLASTIAAGGLPTAAAQPVQFTDVGAAAGLRPCAFVPMGHGLAAEDYDGDGDVDLFVPNARGGGNRLYRNGGDGRFVDVAPAAGLAGPTGDGNDRVALWLDWDGDADLDLVVAGDGFGLPSAGTASLALYRQESPLRFVDATVAAGLPSRLVDEPEQHLGGLCAGDLDRDGDLDLVLALWAGRLRFFRNDGAAGFADASRVFGDESRRHWQPALHDFDGDGWLDLFVAVDYQAPDLLWLNRGDGTFVEAAAAAGLDNGMNDMGIALGDYDGDLDCDLYVTNVSVAGWHSVLHRNDSEPGALRFTEVAAGVGVADAGWAWGATFLDADNDGRLDLAVTNGFDGMFAADRSRFFWNAGGSPVRFVDESQSSGFDDADIGTALVAFDADRDGDLDLAQACRDAQGGGFVRLQDNISPSEHHFLVVRLEMPGANRHAIGAMVRVTAGGATSTRWIAAGTSFLGQEPALAHFGLGEAERVERVAVRWPDGTWTTREGVAADQVLVLAPERLGVVPAPLAVAAFPNPCRVAATVRLLRAGSGPATLEVVDAAGRTRASRSWTEQGAGDHEIVWRAVDGSGRALPAGIYWLVVRGPGGEASQRLVVAR